MLNLAIFVLAAVGDLDPAELKLVVSVRCGEMFGDIPAPENLSEGHGCSMFLRFFPSWQLFHAESAAEVKEKCKM